MTDRSLIVELWMRHSELFWRTVYSVPFVGVAILAGWFALVSGSQFELSKYLLGAGILVMLVQVAILYRMAQYLNTFRNAAGDAIRHVPEAIIGLSGYRIGIAIPVIMIALFTATLALEVEPETKISPEKAPHVCCDSPKTTSCPGVGLKGQSGEGPYSE